MSRPLAIIIGLILLLVLGIAVVFPKYQNLNLLQLKVKEKEAALQSEKEYFSNLSEISEKLKKYEESLSKINSALPTEPKFPTLFDFLQTAASQNGLVLKKITPALPGSLKGELAKEGWNPEIRKTGISLQVSGFYPSFKNFLSTLEKTARMIELESVSFFTLEEVGPIDFNLRIKVYSY
jgi:Tfp pilus assembly protein PilO